MTQELGPNQEAWLKALESGKYKQGRGGLRSLNDEYCCLGVACDLATTAPWHRRAIDWRFANDAAVAPLIIVGRLALFSARGSHKDGERCLTELNDCGKTFPEIAAIVRADPSMYFREPR